MSLQILKITGSFRIEKDEHISRWKKVSAIKEKG